MLCTRCSTVLTTSLRNQGLLILHPDHQSISQEPTPKVWLRDSQVKIKYSQRDPYDRALYTVDVLRSSHMATPAHLSVETIINVAENGIESRVLVDLLKVELKERVDKLTKWDDPENNLSLYSLWLALARSEGVFHGRLARLANGAARSHGYVYEDRNQTDPEEDGDEDGLDQIDTAASEQSSAWWPDPVGGSPSSLAETAMQLLDSGFTPDTCAVLRSKMKAIAEKVLKPCITKYRLAVKMSCSAFVIVGTLPVL